MPNLIEIRERRSAAVAKARAILAKADNEKRNLTADESKDFDAIKAEISDLEAQEQRAQFLDDADRRSTGRVINDSGDTFDALEQRASLIDVLRAGLEGRSLTGASAEMHAELERRHGAPSHGGILVPLSAFERRDANTTTTAADLVATDYRADQFIGPLRASLLVRQLGVRTLSGLRGDVVIPKYGTGVSTQWITEGESLDESGMTFAGVSLTPHHVGSLAEISRQAIQQTAPGIHDLIRDDMSYAIAAAVDAAIVAGTGTDGQPRGVMYTPGVQTAAIPTSWSDVLDVEQQLRGANVTPTGWYTTTAVQTALRKVLKAPTAGSGYIAGPATIGDLPSASSNAAPASTAILGDWSQVLVGQWGAIEIVTNPWANPAFARGGVYVRAFSTVDVAVRHPQAFVVAANGGS
ncbi:phage major capsid protein [uncultured Luteimonas sp.]|uniref:phage major capsid protein n=1 Tax=uncultured Luteimonas sp. TaxID=453144 RepID=UPI0026116694|nr:phage major capsid protein [uncultured Luteimonas sp.]